MKRIAHPSGAEIIFDARWHQYKLGGTALRSVSKLLDRYFPFDEARILQLVSKKTGEPVETIKRQWSRQALLGKNIHEYIEAKLLNRPLPTFCLLLQQKARREAMKPADATGPSSSTSSSLGVASSLEADLLHGEEPLYLPAAEKAVATIQSMYDVLAVEQVIASPEWGIAGTIDFIGRHRTTNQILIGDWKTSGSVVSNFRFGSFETSCPGCLRHLPNSKLYRYAMQVIIYGEVLKRERYFESGFFDAVLESSLKGASAAGSAAAASQEASPRAKTKKSSSVAPTSDAASLLSSLYHEDVEQRLSYGIVQLSKGEDGEVVTEFKEVKATTVLPCDIPEATFDNLLARVMNGEGV